jgi:hypothetical protein
VLIMGCALHDWDSEQKQALIGKACAALPRAARVYETIIDDDRRDNAFGLLFIHSRA